MKRRGVRTAIDSYPEHRSSASSPLTTILVPLLSAQARNLSSSGSSHTGPASGAGWIRCERMHDEPEQRLRIDLREL